MADPKNKWTRPVAPPAPMFFGEKERNLVKQINDELSERVLGQTIAYYPISIEESNFNDIYGEAKEKVSLPPVRVFAYVVVENEQTNERFGYEYQTKLTVNFHRKRLVNDQNLFVRVGDYVQYGDQFYEIVRLYNDTRYYFGQVEHKFQISAECVKARQGAFRVTPAIDRPTDRPPVSGEGQQPAPRDVPYPPLAASYITVAAERKLPNERVLTAGTGITLVDGGAGGALTIAASSPGAAGIAGAVQLQDGSGVSEGSSNLVFLTGSNRLGIGTDEPSHEVTVVGSVSASADVLIGGDLTVKGIVIGGSPLKIAGAIQVVDTNNTTEVLASVGDTAGDGTVGLSGSLIEGTSLTASLAYLPNIVSTTQISASTVLADSSLWNDITCSSFMSSSLYYGDGRYLTNVTASAVEVADGPEFSIQFRYDSPIGREISGSSSLTFITSSNTLSLLGDLSASTNISASAFYGDGSNLTGIASTAKGVAGSLQFKTGSAEMTGSSTVTYDIAKNRLTVAGGLIHNRTAVSTSHTASGGDYILGVTTVPTNILFDAATFVTGQVVVIKDETGNASSANSISLNASGLQTIDGNSSAHIESPYGSALLYTDGADWFIY